jgi:hypothetical protein
MTPTAMYNGHAVEIPLKMAERVDHNLYSPSGDAVSAGFNANNPSDPLPLAQTTEI